MTVLTTDYERTSPRSLCAEQSPKESDDNKCCSNAIHSRVLNGHLKTVTLTDAVLIQYTLVTCVLNSHLKRVTIPNDVLIQYTLVTCVLKSHLKRVTIPDAVLIQFVLLKMSTIVPETCREI